VGRSLDDGEMHVWRVADITRADLLDATFERPADFDLAAFWQAWCMQAEQTRPRFEVRVCIAPRVRPVLPGLLGDGVEVEAQTDDPSAESIHGEGWPVCRLTFSSFEDARARLLALGGEVEVLEPPALRLSLSDFAQQIVQRYPS
jgi:hypothetical protein